MSETPFFKTRMAPCARRIDVRRALVKQLERLNELLERLVDQRQDREDTEA